MYLQEDDSKNGPIDTGDIEVPKDDISFTEETSIPDEDDRESDDEPKEPDTTEV